MKILAILTIALVAGAHAGTYTDRFLEQYQKIKSSGNGYFSKDNVPYHSVETLIVEAPDHGHETTSEAFSYYVWLEAMYGAIQGDFSSFNSAWSNLEQYAIPKLQSSNSFYTPEKPASYAPELDDPSQYPAAIDSSVTAGQDPIAAELKSAYGSDDVYSMHWLFDVDNVYGFGNIQGQCEAGPGSSGPSLYNNYQRGPQESVWKTIPQPTCDEFKYGGTNGFLDLFVQDQSYAHQYKYTAAPDADARAVQAAYWAGVWAAEKGATSQVSATLDKAAKLGDYLRYSLFDKYFKKIGNCIDAHSCAAGTGKDSAHYLISWYFAWGGSYNAQYGWAWRIADGASHFGYQNPLAAYALTSSLKPKGSSAVQDWTTSLQRQIELYEYLQTSEGAFSGGVTNSWKGRYDQPESDLLNDTFHGMFYDWEPVYHDPPSNRWYGMQPWSADRLAQYYYASGDSQAQAILAKWSSWVTGIIQFDGDDFNMPSNLGWTGDPPNVHVTVQSYGKDLGTAAATARTLAYYAAKSGDTTAKDTAKKLLDGLYNNYRDTLGYGTPEPRDDYNRFNDKVYVPSGWTGKYPNGDTIDSSATFIGIRSWYKNDPNWSKVEAYLNGGAVPTFTYHRFWAQADIALAFGAYGLLFNE